MLLVSLFIFPLLATASKPWI